MKLAITTYCTDSYAYAIEAQIPLCISAIKYAKINPEELLFIMVGDNSKNVDFAFNLYEKSITDLGGLAERIILDIKCNKNASHEKNSNLVIAKMQNAAWQRAKIWGAEAIWSLESDILPQPNSLRTLLDAVSFDNGYYDVAMNTYPNSEFLGGHGSHNKWINPSTLPEERNIPESLKMLLKEKEDRIIFLQKNNIKPSEEEIKNWQQIEKKIEECPSENIFALNAKGWRKRGWLSSAYPAIGLGAMLPTDWVGLGSTLITRKALELANFSGYDGGGTQDLWLCWKVWYPANIKMSVITHSICSHVKRKPAKYALADSKMHGPFIGSHLVIMRASHETDPNFFGHLRMEEKIWDGI